MTVKKVFYAFTTKHAFCDPANKEVGSVLTCLSFMLSLKKTLEYFKPVFFFWNHC